MFGNYKFKIGIIGTGKMGTDIFYYLNDYDFNIVWLPEDDNIKNELAVRYLKKLDRNLKNNLIDLTQYNGKKENTVITTDHERLKDRDLIIEAITEDANIKKKLFNKLINVVNNQCIFASNSSSFIPGKICPDNSRLKKFICMHFFYPVKLKNIVEIVKTDKTDDDDLNMVKAFLKKINKFYLIQNEKDPFILNRILLPIQFESYNILNEYKLSPAQVDLIIESIFPIGVFKIIDSVGIDVICPAIKEYRAYYNKSYLTDYIAHLESMIKDNKLGIKTKKGYYDYNNLTETNEDINHEIFNDIKDRLLFLYINTVYKFIENKTIDKKDADFALKEYLDVKKGPVELSKEFGLEKIFGYLNNYYNKSNNELYKPSNLLKNDNFL